MASSQHSDDIEKASVEKGRTEHRDRVRPISVALTPEQYERLFLEPGGKAPPVSKLSKQFGNPTPLAIMVFTLCLAPTACILLGWAGADPTSMVTMLAPFYFQGGIGLIVSSILEWILGNTFSYVVFMLFGGFWLAFGAINDPSIGIGASYAASGGAASPAFNSALMWYFAFFAVIAVILFVASLRTNVVFAFIFLTLIVILVLFSASYGRMTVGDVNGAVKLSKAAGGVCLATSAAGFYLTIVLIFGCVEMPFHLPVGDLSGVAFVKKKTA
ncbi:hypothetical protein V5O48_007485 [Marasmius crinis-equi]|uniref:GPR1/FUN34/YaaH-class plasma membrane protein n=1 Tax=Marasmius crinis-equi TaxID=585013 RepID=A0ABR3FGJ3_9AGAR